MSRAEAIVDAITDHSKIAIALMLVLTVMVGAGASQVEQSSSLDQFQSDTPEAEDLEYIETNFSTGPDNTTTAQIIVRGGNVLEKDALLETLRYQQALRDDPAIGPTLVEDSPTVGIANVLAQASIQGERARELRASAGALENRSVALNETAGRLKSALDTVRSNPDADIRTLFEGVDANTSVDLDDEDYAIFRQAAEGIRSNVSAMQQAIETGTRSTLGAEFAALEERRVALNRTGQLLRDALDTVRADPNASIQAQFEGVDANTSVDLDDADYAAFRQAAEDIRSNVSAMQQAIETGTRSTLGAEFAALEERRVALNRTGQLLRDALDTVRADPNASIQAQFEGVDANTGVDLDEEDYAIFEDAATTLRNATSESAIEDAYRQGTDGVLADEGQQLAQRAETLNGTARLVGEALGTVAQDPTASARTQFEAVDANTSVGLDETNWAAFNATVTDIRGFQTAIETNYRRGTQGVLADDSQQLAQRAETLNGTARLVGEALGTVAQDPTASARTQFEAVDANTSVGLDETNWEAFNATVTDIREFQAAVEDAYRRGTQGVLAEEFEALQSRGAELQAEREALQSGEQPSLSAQIDQLESMNATQLESTINLVLGDGSNGGGNGALGFMSSEYDRGSTAAEATMVLVTQRTDSAVSPGGTVSDRIVDSQLAMQDLGDDYDREYLVFGSGLITDEINRSMTDSMLIVGPLALVFVLLALAIGYRDILDIILGLFGIGAVLVWTFGFMGWTDIAFNQIFIAVPVLLIGLSIDYAIHIFMRHREERQQGDGLGPRGSMRTALAGVGVALTLVTATTVIGFLSNLTSPVPPIKDFGVVSSVGITAALLVFGVMIPAMKVELDEFLEGYGFDRRKRAIGTGGGRLSQALKAGSIGARKAPYVVIGLALLLSIGGAYGGTQVDTTFAQEDFLAEDPPGWMEDLPEPFQPGEYTAKNNLEYVNERFVREDSQAQLLIRGDITTAEGLQRIADARESLAAKDVTQKLSGGEPDVQSPLSVMRTVAADNETFNATFTAADTDGDGVPDENVRGVYDTLFEVAPDQAGSILYADGDSYEAARIVVSIQGTASSSDVTEQMRSVADSLSGNGLEVTATGQTILFEIVQDQLLETVIQSLLITLVAVFAFLMVVYRISDGSATLGFVTLLPVVLSVAWILGTMYVFDIPFNVMTGMITSLTVGLGVAYSIHLSERYNQELERSDSVWDALDRSVTGTGGALLGSAATTVGGFGVLVFAILPPLQQFGLITGLTIIYAFLASVLVLPSLLVVWTRLFGPEWAFTDEGGDEPPEEPPATGEHPPAGVEGAAASAPPRRGVTAERSVYPSEVVPGETMSATIRVAGASGRVVLQEWFEGQDLELYSVTPEPVEYAVRDSTLFLAWERPTEPIVVEYDGVVPGDATDGSAVGFDGRVLTPDFEAPVGGRGSVRVVTDVYDRILADGTVTGRDFRLAADQFAAGALTEREFEEIAHLWLESDERSRR